MTVAGAPGDSATVGGINFNGGLVSDITFEGIQFTGGVWMTGCAANLAFDYDNLQDLSDTNAFYLDPPGDGSCTQTNISMEYDQMSAVGDCLEMDSSTQNSIDGVNFSHDVCGPDIGYGCNAGTSCNSGGHYIQMGNLADITIAHDAFLGPPNPNWNPTCNPSYSHINVLHVTGSSENLTFSNNLIWHTEACGESVLLQSGIQSNLTFTNNLLVEAPGTGVGYSMMLLGSDGLNLSNNTLEGSGIDSSGIDLNGDCTDCGQTDNEGVTAQGNLVVGYASPGNKDFSGWDCATGTCTSGGNVSDDGSALSWGPAAGNVGNWTPTFISTSWTPNTGSPWSPPPAGYYQPTNESAGYQGTVGP